MINDPLQLPLRDIHQPEPISWWPPAPGWWILITSIIAVAMLGLWLRRRRIHKQQSIKVLSLRRLQDARSAFEEHRDSQRLLRELSILLRRASMSVHHREETAALTGEAWLKFLDQNLGGQHFTKGPGRLLIEAPYQRRPRVDASNLMRLCEDWIRSLPERPAGDRT